MCSSARRSAICQTSQRHPTPASVRNRRFASTGFTGALIAYWFDGIELNARAATYIDRILRGASPADLPVQYPTKYRLLINLKTAKAIGLTLPESLLARADEIVE